MYGYVNGKPVNNPVTGEHTCPDGFNENMILGTSAVDFPLYYCNKPIDDIANAERMKEWKPSPGAMQFGGMIGVVGGAVVNNPISRAITCPVGFYKTRVFGTGAVDYDAHFCSREW